MIETATFEGLTLIRMSRGSGGQGTTQDLIRSVLKREV
jgi:hypothetical protein